MSAEDRERPNAPRETAHEPKRSILERLNLDPFKQPGEKAVKDNGGFVDSAPSNPNEPGPEHERAEKSTGASEPKAAQTEPISEERQNREKSDQWDHFEVAYVESGKSLKKLAAEFGVAYSTAKRRAQEGRWKEKRAAFQSQIRQQRLAQALLTKVEVFGIQQSAALETGAIFQAIFEDRARKLRENPSAKGAVSDLAKLIDLQLDIEELVLTILGDLELHARAAKLGGGEPPIH